MPACDLARKAKASTWSVLEIIEHLVIAQRLVLGDFDRLHQRAPRGNRKWVPYLMVLFVLRFRIPVRAPSPGFLPNGSRSLEELRRDWDNQHAQLLAFVTALKRDDLQRIWFCHPIAGNLTVGQGVLMLEAHLDTHIRQVTRRSSHWQQR